MAEIIPSVGRKVWYRPSEDDLAGSDTPPMTVLGEDPLDATIVAVHSEENINVIIFDTLGVRHFRENVRLLQQNGVYSTSEGVAQWMPYQYSVTPTVGTVKV